jgi:MoxR-like ATPase/Mg-chelatase subunit ChlD
MSALDRLRAGLEASAVGQARAKRALLLGLIARQPVLLWGPPGCGKSRLARALARLAGARCAEPVLHRDLRGEDLLGDPLLLREAAGSGERIRRARLPSPFQDAEVWLLDGITGAPNAALAPLMRRLDARSPLPLELLIATADLPAQQRETLEPAWLDRFPLRVRMSGLLSGRCWKEARALLELDGGETETAEPLAAHERHALQRAAAALPFARGIERAWLAILDGLRAVLEPSEAARLSDRALLATAPPLLRANALLRGAPRVELEDLVLARELLEPRVAPGRRELIDAALAPLERRPVEAAPPAAVGQSGSPGETGGGVQHARPTELRVVSAEVGALAGPPLREADVDALVHLLEGQWARGRRGRAEDPAGAPRGQRRMRGLEEFPDADPLEAWMYAQGRWPGEPRVWRRERRGSGALVVLRDVSASMEGSLGRWAGEVSAALVRGAQRGSLRVGYVEFDHEATVYRERGRFFARDLEALLAAVAQARSGGRTNYQAPLCAALRELRRVPGAERHVVLLTDGLPVAGDPEVRAERALARRMGVRVHCVFIGLGAGPPVLERLAQETGGLEFRARPMPGGQIRVESRESPWESKQWMNV